MVAPRYTVIVPVTRFWIDEPVLASLRENCPGETHVQIIVAEGSHPARQRNAAVAQAEGEILVFLDNDCRLGPDFWKELEAAFARPGVEIVGGPALLEDFATPSEKIFHALLSNSLVVGPVSPRYEARGVFRATTQTELILCNLAARRTIFERIGPLSTDLYPNEENEWLDRAQAAGIGIYYDPDLQIFRPQRTTGARMIRMLVRYGIGRTRQLKVSGWKVTLHQALPLAVFLPLLALVMKSPGLTLMIFLWLAYAGVIAATCSSLRMNYRIRAGLIAPLLPLAYALGQVIGWFLLGAPPKNLPPILLYDEKGNPLTTNQENNKGEQTRNS